MTEKTIHQGGEKGTDQFGPTGIAGPSVAREYRPTSLGQRAETSVLNHKQISQVHEAARSYMDRGGIPNKEEADRVIQTYRSLGHPLTPEQETQIRESGLLVDTGAGMAIIGEYVPPENSSEWFCTNIRAIEGSKNFFAIPGWSETRRQERFEDFLGYEPDYQTLYDARIQLHNITKAIEDPNPSLETIEQLSNNWEMKFFNELFRLTGVSLAWQTYETVGDQFIDANGDEATEARVNAGVRAAITATYPVQTRVDPRHQYFSLQTGADPRYQYFSLEDAQEIGYRLWVFTQRKDYFMARQLFRVMRDPTRNYGFTSVYGRNYDNDMPIGASELEIDQKIINRPIAGLYNPWFLWRFFDFGGRLGREVQKYLYDNRFDLGIFDLISRRANVLAVAYAKSQGIYPGIVAGIRAAKPGIGVDAVDQKIAKQLRPAIGLGVASLLPEDRGDELEDPGDVIGKNIWGEERRNDDGKLDGGFIEDLSGFDPSTINWELVPRNFYSVTRNAADHKAAGAIKDQVGAMIANPLPEAAMEINGVSGYLTEPNWRRIYYLAFGAMVRIHKSKLPNSNRIFGGTIPLSEAGVRGWQAINWAHIEEMLVKAHESDRITASQMEELEGGKVVRVALSVDRMIQPRAIIGAVARVPVAFLKALLGGSK